MCSETRPAREPIEWGSIIAATGAGLFVAAVFIVAYEVLTGHVKVMIAVARPVPDYVPDMS